MREHSLVFSTKRVGLYGNFPEWRKSWTKVKAFPIILHISREA